MGWQFVGLASFTAYAIAHNIGASVLSGAVIRYRAYSTKGLSVAEIGVLVAFCSFTFALGAVTLGGLLLFVRPDSSSASTARRCGSARPGRSCCSPRRRSYVIGSLLHFRPFRLGGFELVYPRPPVAARQLLAGPLELIGGAGIIFFALPAAANPGFIVVLGVFLASFSLALVSHAPGGLGVLEIAFLEECRTCPRPMSWRRCLVFRLLYLILPLVFALCVVLAFEQHRWRTFVNTRSPPHALGDRD